MENSDSMPTDMMWRRTPLSLRGRFFLFGIIVVIDTNYESILRAAGKLWFTPVSDTNQTPAAKWEIVGAPASRLNADWKCNVTLGDHSLYLSMGPEQWFAFDLETNDAAGFVLIRDYDPDRDANAERYLTAIAFNLGVSMRTELEKSCRE
jgi:hypothetical protein